MRPRYRERGLIGLVRTLARVFADLVGAYRHMPNMVELADGSVWIKLLDQYGAPAPRVQLPEVNPWLAKEAQWEARTDAAFEMVGEDVYGYMVFLLKRTPTGGALVFRCQTETPWVKVFTSGFARVLDGIEGMEHVGR